MEALEQLQEEQQVYTKQEAAEFLKVKEHTIDRLAFKEHELAYSKVGKHAVFLRGDLFKLLKKRRTPSVYDTGV